MRCAEADEQVRDYCPVTCLTCTAPSRLKMTLAIDMSRILKTMRQFRLDIARGRAFACFHVFYLLHI